MKDLTHLAWTTGLFVTWFQTISWALFPAVTSPRALYLNLSKFLDMTHLSYTISYCPATYIFPLSLSERQWMNFSHHSDLSSNIISSERFYWLLYKMTFPITHFPALYSFSPYCFKNGNVWLFFWFLPLESQFNGNLDFFSFSALFLTPKTESVF